MAREALPAAGQAGNGGCPAQGHARAPLAFSETRVPYQPEWGTKRTCPQTGVRFYDFGRDNPVTSPSGHQWTPEPILKSKQPLPFDAPKPETEKEVDADAALETDDLDLENEEAAEVADETDDLGGEEDLTEVPEDRESE
jgi:uncharacterized protein (TIGR02300 family)